MTTNGLVFPDREKVFSNSVRAPKPLQMESPGGEKAPILLAQSDPVRMIVLHQALVEQGYFVIAALNGVEAMEELRRESCPAVAILDAKLPLLMSHDICRRAQEAGKRVYFILTVETLSPAEVISGLDAGASVVLPTSVTPPELIAQVKAGLRLLSDRPAQDDAQTGAQTVDEPGGCLV